MSLRSANRAFSHTSSIWSIVCFRPKYTLDNATEVLGEFSLEETVGDVYTRNCVNPPHRILDEERKEADVRSNLFLFYAHCGLIRVGETNSSDETSLGSQREPPKLESFPMASLYLDLPDFMYELKRRLIDAGLTSGFKLLNEYGDELLHSYPSIAVFLRETRSSGLLIRLDPSIPLRPVLRENATEREKAQHEALESRLSHSSSMSITLREGVTLSVANELLSVKSGALEFSEEVRKALRKLLSLLPDKKTRHRLAEAQSSSEAMASRQSSPEPTQSDLARLVQENESLKSEIAALNTRLQQPSRYMREIHAWKARFTRAAHIALFLVQQELTMVFFYSVFWLCLIDILGPNMFVMKAAISTYLAVNVFMTVLKSRYGVDLGDAIVDYTLPKLYPEDPVAHVSGPVIQEIASRLQRREAIDYNELLDTLVQKPSLVKTLGISFFSVIPSILNKWHKSTDKQREDAQAAIIAAAEYVNEKRKLREE